MTHLYGYFHLLNLKNFQKLKNQIKKNEGFRDRAYQDQLGHWTIGYGHLIKANEKNLLNKKYSKVFLNNIFKIDFNTAKNQYKKLYENKKIPHNIVEFLIEMIFQLGILGHLKFVKMNKHIFLGEYYMAALEIKKSLWYKQTPNRVNLLIKKILKQYVRRK